jgi:malyl-CoA/(S)-citramalyl-CoA lyase
MSFTQTRAPGARLNRSQLSVPGIRPELFEKAARSAADVVMLDLEDAVAPGDKDRARALVIQGLNEIDWRGKPVGVRINGLDTPFMYRDVIALVEQAGARLDLLMIPKAGVPADLYALDMLVTQIETSARTGRRLGFQALIESALGLANVEAIAAASPRLESLHFGPADLAATLGIRSVAIGGGDPDSYVLGADGQTRHLGDSYHHHMARMAVAARAHGVLPIDSAYGDFQNAAGFEAAARRARALGYAGKWAIHPTQIAPANAIFSPSAAEVAQARRVIAAIAEGAAGARGAVVLDGRMLDQVSVRQAEAIVAMADRIG